MRKRTRIAVGAAALLLAMVAPIATSAPDQHVAQASAPQPGAVVRQLQGVIPRVGLTRTGRPVYLTSEQWWRLAKVACKTNDLHDKIHEYEPTVDYLLSQTDVPNPYRYQSHVLELSRQLYQLKQDGGLMVEGGTTVFCGLADHRLKRSVTTAPR